MHGTVDQAAMQRPSERYHYVEQRGLPPAGDTGQWFGYDEHGFVYVLQWNMYAQCWQASGFHPRGEVHQPHATDFLCQAKCAGVIVRSARAPLYWQQRDEARS